MARYMQAHPMPAPSRWRAFVEHLLPWYNPHVERLRDARTEAIRQRSVNARVRAEKVVDEYRQADRK